RRTAGPAPGVHVIPCRRSRRRYLRLPSSLANSRFRRWLDPGAVLQHRGLREVPTARVVPSRTSTAVEVGDTAPLPSSSDCRLPLFRDGVCPARFTFPTWKDHGAVDRDVSATAQEPAPAHPAGSPYQSQRLRSCSISATRSAGVAASGATLRTVTPA